MTPWTKRLAIALAVSLGVNLVWAGFFVGRQFIGPYPFAGRSDTVPAGALGGRRAPVLQNALESRGDEFRERREAIRKARVRAREVLAQPKYDRAALEQALSSIQAETSKNQELMHQAILEAAASATPAQRQELGRALGSEGRGRGADGRKPGSERRGRPGGRGLGPDGAGR